jgi:Fic family protein
MAENPWVIAVAAEFVFRFLAIHPFQDGNGRLSRLLFHLALMARENSVYRGSAPLCAIDRTIEQSRKRYYYVLQRCSDGVFSPDPGAYRYAFFLDYLIEVLEKSLENFSYYEKKYEHYQQLSKTALRILNCFKSEPEQSFATGAIVELSGIPRRTAVYSLNTLLDYGFVNREGKGRGSRYRLVF